jgi:hypothetical protein
MRSFRGSTLEHCSRPAATYTPPAIVSFAVVEMNWRRFMISQVGRSVPDRRGSFIPRKKSLRSLYSFAAIGSVPSSGSTSFNVRTNNTICG